MVGVKTNPSPIRLAAAFGAALALTLAACGGDDSDDTGGADTVADVAEADEASDAADSSAAITIAEFAFDGVAEVSVGTTVVVTNTDGAQHTWSAVDGTFDSGALGQGESFEFTFTEPGEFEYFCNFHPSMTGTIVVTA